MHKRCALSIWCCSIFFQSSLCWHILSEAVSILLAVFTAWPNLCFLSHSIFFLIFCILAMTLLLPVPWEWLACFQTCLQCGVVTLTFSHFFGRGVCLLSLQHSRDKFSLSNPCATAVLFPMSSQWLNPAISPMAWIPGPCLEPIMEWRKDRHTDLSTMELGSGRVL